MIWPKQKPLRDADIWRGILAKPSMHRTTPKEKRLLASLKVAMAAMDVSLVREIEALAAEELDKRREELTGHD